MKSIKPIIIILIFIISVLVFKTSGANDGEGEKKSLCGRFCLKKPSVEDDNEKKTEKLTIKQDDKKTEKPTIKPGKRFCFKKSSVDNDKKKKTENPTIKPDDKKTKKPTIKQDDKKIEKSTIKQDEKKTEKPTIKHGSMTLLDHLSQPPEDEDEKVENIGSNKVSDHDLENDEKGEKNQILKKVSTKEVTLDSAIEPQEALIEISIEESLKSLHDADIARQKLATEVDFIDKEPTDKDLSH